MIRLKPQFHNAPHWWIIQPKNLEKMFILKAVLPKSLTLWLERAQWYKNSKLFINIYDPYEAITFQAFDWALKCDPFWCSSILSNPIWSSSIFSNPLWSSLILFNPIRSSQILFDPFRSSQILFDPLQSSSILSDPLRSSSILWHPIRSCPILFNPLEVFGHFWAQKRFLRIWIFGQKMRFCITVSHSRALCRLVVLVRCVIH